MPRPKTILITCFSFFFGLLYGQKYISDSTIIHFYPNQKGNSKKSFQIYNFKDKRANPGKLFHVGEKKQYWVVPVDYRYLFEDLLMVVLENCFETDSSAIYGYKLEIEVHQLQPSYKKGLVSRHNLHSCILVKNILNNRTDTLGYMVFETSIPMKSVPLDSSQTNIDKPVKQIKSNNKLAYEKLFYNWQSEIIHDINNLLVTPPVARSFIVPNFKPISYSYKKDLYMKAAYLQGKDWYGLEGEIFFSFPEARDAFSRNTGSVRYLNTPSYESLLMGKDNENFYWRLSPTSIFEVQSKILMGINRWKDTETTEHKLEEIFQACLSLSQLYQFNKLDKKGLVFSLGLVEDVFYIYNKVDFRFGFKVHIGLKL